MITLLALAAFGPSADPLDRYQAFRAAHPTIQVAVTATFNGKQRMAGDITIQPPNRFIYRAKWGGYDYSLASSEKAYVEIERTTRMYDEQMPTGQLMAFSSEIDALENTALPRFLFFSNIKSQLAPKGWQITKKSGYDEAYVKVTSQMGATQELWLDIDGAGKLLTLHQHTKSQAGESNWQWSMSNYRYPLVGLSAFITPLPLGYMPYSIPRLGTPLQMGQPAPVSGWTAANGSRLDLLKDAAGNPFLIVVLGADSLPSKSARASLPAIESKVKVYLVGPGGLSDPTGKLMARLSVPATPMFYLIDEKGKVKKLWQGYDPTQARAFEQDVIQSAGGASATK